MIRGSFTSDQGQEEWEAVLRFQMVPVEVVLEMVSWVEKSGTVTSCSTVLSLMTVSRPRTEAVQETGEGMT